MTNEQLFALLLMLFKAQRRVYRRLEKLPPGPEEDTELEDIRLEFDGVMDDFEDVLGALRGDKVFLPRDADELLDTPTP